MLQVIEKTKTISNKITIDNFYQSIEYNKHFENLENLTYIKIGSDTKQLSENGIWKVKDIIHDSLNDIKTNMLVYWSDINNNFDNFDFDLDKSKGKITKRIKKHVFKTWEHKLTDSQISNIGNNINNNLIIPDSYYYDFNDNFNWQDGDFGDSGSCFWDGRENAKDMIQSESGFALRLYDTDRNGIGRIWIIPIENGMILFNGYLNDNYDSTPTKLISNIFEQILINDFGLKTNDDFYIKKIGLDNRDSSGGTLWINSDSGFMFSLKEYDYGSYDFNISEYPNDNYQVCFECSFDIDTEYHEYHIQNENYYCNDCFNNLFSYCEYCNDYHDSDDFYIINDDFICSDCVDNHYNKCDDCGEYHESDELIKLVKSNNFNNIKFKKDIINYYCKECINNHTDNYCECCELIKKDSQISKYKNHNKKILCKDCLKSYIPVNQKQLFFITLDNRLINHVELKNTWH